MSWLRRRWWLVLLCSAAVAALVLSLRDPYRPAEVERNMRLAGACNPEALDYLGDYYEKRGDEGKLHETLELQRKCRATTR
jgi:hypothetical protein